MHLSFTFYFSLLLSISNTFSREGKATDTLGTIFVKLNSRYMLRDGWEPLDSKSAQTFFFLS